MQSPFKINGTSIEIPLGWDELTFGQFLAIKQSKTDNEVLSRLTGIDIDLCDQIPPETLLIILSPLLSITQEEAPQVEVETICGEPVPLKIGKKEFARKVNCDAAMKKLKDIELIGRIVSVYCSQGTEDIDIENFEKKLLSERFIFVFSAGRILLEQLGKLNESEKKIPATQYRSEEIRAGVNEFKKYGVVGLVRGIALKWGISKQDVFKWSYNDVLLELKISADENNYQRKLQEILSPKKK